MPVMKLPRLKLKLKLKHKVQRGYLLLEMVVCGALAAVILAGILSQLVRARNLNVATGRDVIASQLVLERLEIARNTPFTNAAIANGITSTDTPLSGYTRTMTVSNSCSEAMTFPAPALGATALCKDITVTVTFRMNQTGAGSGLQTRTSQAQTRIYQ
jgi:hypothetical protein